jgi:hypothetical protein
MEPSRPWQKPRNPGYAGESACATPIGQQFAESGGAGIQPAGLLPQAARKARQKLVRLNACPTLLCVVLITTATAQTDPASRLEASIHREVVEGDIRGAMIGYRTIAGDTAAPHNIVARSLLQLAQCQEKLGQRKEARATYARIVRDWSSETEIAAQARAQLAGWTDALPGPRNLRFEEGEAGKVPPGWFVPVVEKTTGSLAELRRKGCRTEGGCAVVTAPATSPGTGGNLMQSFSAAAYRGKTVRLRGWVRVEAASPEDRAQMWLHVDRPNGRLGFVDDMDDRPVRPSDWTSCEIVAEIDRDAQFLDFGVTAIGRGRVWVDDVTLDVVPEEQITAARNAIRRQYAGDTSITGFRFTGAEAVATIRVVGTRQGFARVEVFHDTWERTGEGWRLREHAAAASYYEAPDPDPDLAREVAADLRKYATPLGGIGPAVAADCFALHRPEMPRGAAESLLSGAGLRSFFLDIQRVPGESMLGRWLAEPHLFAGEPATLGRSCTGIVFVEATQAPAN